MPETPVYQLPYELEPSGINPGHTLTGGPAGEDPILAEAVEDELERVDSSLSSLVSQVNAIIPAGLTTIDSGEATANFTVSVPTGEFSMVRLWMTGHLDGTGRVFVRVNEDSTTDLHQRNWMLRTAATGALADSASGSAGTRFYAARWASQTNSGFGHVMDTWFGDAHITARCPMVSRSWRQGGSGSGAQKLEAWGNLSDNRLLESIQVQAVDAAFTSARWVLQGVPV